MSVANIPDEYLGCLISMRHPIPFETQRRQRVRIRYDAGTLDLIEFYGVCPSCGTERTMVRTDPASNDGRDEFVQAQYRYPDGYLAPKGEPWDRAELRREFSRRHQLNGRRVERNTLFG